MTGTTPRCATCGSDDVVRDAWASWDPHQRRWAIDAVFDETWCHTCVGSTHIVRAKPMPTG